MIKTKSQVGICSPPATTLPGPASVETPADGIISAMAVSEHDRDLLRLFRPPRLRTLDDGERHASYLELFFDLVFVVAIAQLAHELVIDHSLGGFAVFVALYLPVFIAWQGFSIYADRFDTDDVVFRVAILLGMLAILVLALQIREVADGDGTAFAIAYVTLRSLMIGLYLRSYAHVPEARPLIVRYAGGYSLGVALWVVSLALDSPERYVLWGVALVWEYSLPWLSRRFHASIPVHASHVPERFALFTIIVLGESVLAVALGVADRDWQLSGAVIAGLGFLVASAIWWTYFGSGVELSVERSATSILVFAYVHIPLLAALTAVGAGITLAIEQSGADHLDSGARWALAGGAAAYLMCVTVAQRTLVTGFLPRTAQSRLAGVVALVAVALLGATLDPVVFTAVTTAVLVGLVVFKLWAAQHALATSGRSAAVRVAET
jgi:low temperature requirement protein LtrA